MYKRKNFKTSNYSLYTSKCCKLYKFSVTNMKTKIFLKFVIIGLFTLLSVNSNAQSTYSMKNIKLTTIVFSYTDYFEFSEYMDFYDYIFNPTGIIYYNDSNSTDIWQICIPNKGEWDESLGLPYIYPATDSKVLMTDSVYSYPPNNHSSFEVHMQKPEWAIINNCPWRNMRIYFTYKCETDTLKDGLFIEISFDGGNTFVNLLDSIEVYSANNGPNNISFDFSNVTYVQDTILGFSGHSIDNSSYNLTAFDYYLDWDNPHELDVEYAIIQFHFLSDDVDFQKKGILIDHISASVTYNNVIGIESTKGSIKKGVFPNPINEMSKLFFDNNGSCSVKLTLFNNTGNVIYTEITNDSFFEIGKISLQKGLYIYQLTDEKKIKNTGKLIKY